jgi:hypothetical protein
MDGCVECQRLLNLCLDASQELVQAQSELARYRPAREDKDFPALWERCQEAMRATKTVRQEVARHLATHELAKFPVLVPA